MSLDSVVTLFDRLIAINITLPGSGGNGSRLIDLIAAGTVLTPSADLPTVWTATGSQQYLSATADNGSDDGGTAISGSSPLTRFFARKCAQVIIENHAAAFTTDYAPAMPAAISRASGTAWTSAPGLDGVRRVYVRNSAAGTAVVTALCFLMPQPVARS